MLQDEVRDNLSNLKKDAGYTVEIGPNLHLLRGESFNCKSMTSEGDARLDIEWSMGKNFGTTLFDLKIFNPLVKTCSMSITVSYDFYEKQKNWSVIKI